MESRGEEAVEGRAGHGEEEEEEGFRAGGAGGPAVDVPKEDVAEAGGGGEGFRGREASADERAEQEGNGVVFPEGADEIAGVGERGGPGFRVGVDGVDEGPKEELDGADAVGSGTGARRERGFREDGERVEVGGEVGQGEA